LFVQVFAGRIVLKVWERFTPGTWNFAKCLVNHKGVEVFCRIDRTLRLKEDDCPVQQDVSIVWEVAITGAGACILWIVHLFLELDAPNVPSHGKQRDNHACGNRVGI
jgi:hypothetical protein